MGIAQALLGNPPFLIFDEPTVGLDPEERIHFRNLFSRTAQDRLVLLSTHIIEDVQSVCDQLVVIHHGRILFTGTPAQLIQAAAGHVGVFWEQAAAQEQGLHITARVNTSQGIRCRAVADRLPDYVQPEEPTLEDAYLYLISREAAPMKTLRLFPLELRRLLQSRLTWLAALLTVLSPLAGLAFYKPATASTMLSMYLANPAIAGGVAGGILFGLLTVFELDRANRSRVEVLLDAAVSPLTMALVRLFALLAAALLTLCAHHAGLAPHQPRADRRRL